MSEYPTESQLSDIEHWDIIAGGVMGLLCKLQEAWHWPEWGYKLTGKRTLKLELHTGGWSCNEEIIDALQKNPMFWGAFWQKSLKGGHYYFRIGKSFIEKK
jgi:hypothetical protein